MTQQWTRKGKEKTGYVMSVENHAKEFELFFSFRLQKAQWTFKHNCIGIFLFQEGQSVTYAEDGLKEILL